MKKALFFAGLAAAFAFVGCNREADLAGNGKSVDIILTNVDTRTVNQSMSTVWGDNDELSVFYAPAGTETWSANTKFTVTDAASNRATGEVELTADAYDWYLFYPYTRQLPNPTTLNPEGSQYERSGYTTVGGQFQTQAGDGDMAHLAGKKVPVYGNVKNVAAADMPVVTMKNAAAVVRFAVQNKLTEPIHILSVKFTAPEDIVGTYYIDFSGDAPSFVGSGDSYVFDNVTVTNGNPLSIAADVTPEFYAVIKPFTAPAGATLKVEIEAESADGLKRGSVTKEVTLTEAAAFQAGKFKTLNLKFDGTLSKIAAEELPYEESFANGQGEFTVENVTGSIWAPANAGGQQCMKGTSFSGSNQEGEGWLISPEIDGTTAQDGIKLSFKQCVNKYFVNVAEEATLWAREKGGEWTQYTITYPTPNGTWSAFEEQVVDLSAFMGKTFQFAFKYVGHTTGAGTWEICDVAVTDETVAAYTFLAELEGEDKIAANITSVTIKVTGNVAWTADPSEGVTLDKTSGEGNATITASFAANTDTSPKNYSVVVRTDNTEVDNDEWEITFTQAAADASGETTVTVDFSAQGYENGYEMPSPTTIAGVSFSFSKGDNGNGPKYYSTGTAVRLYGSNSMTVSVPGKTLISITLGFSSGEGTNAITTDVPTYVEPSWTGEAGSVTFTIGGTNGHRRIKTVTVKYKDGGSVTPTPVNPTLTVTPSPLSVVKGETATLTVETNSDGAKTWTSSDSSVATVVDGVVTGVKAGTATITLSVAATASYNAATADVPVTVTEPVVGGNTVSMTMTEYVSEHGCTISAGSSVTVYTTLQLNPSVRMSTTGEANCGSFWGTSTQDWRLYQNKNGNVIVSVADGCELKSVKLTFGVSNTGVLLDASGNKVTSGTANTVSGTSVEYTVGNSGEATNGQVKITAVEVVYTGNGTTFPDTPSTEITTVITMAGNKTVYIGETVELNATSNVTGAPITYESEDPSIATVNASGVVTGVAEGEVKVYARVAAVEGEYTAAERYCVVTVSEKPGVVEGTWESKSLASIADGTEFILVSTNASGASYAMSNDKGSSNPPEAVAVTVSGNTLSNPASNLVFVLNKTSDGYIFKLKGGESWLYCYNNNNGLRVGTSEHNLFRLDSESGYLVINDGTQDRYVGVYNEANWRSYTSVNNNIKDQTFTFFVKK